METEHPDLTGHAQSPLKHDRKMDCRQNPCLMMADAGYAVPSSFSLPLWSIVENVVKFDQSHGDEIAAVCEVRGSA